jgi:hypothetical protein
MQNPLNFNEIDINNIVYKNIDASANNKIIFLKYKEENILKNFVVQVPKYECKIDNNIITLLTLEESSKQNKFINFIDSVEKKIQNDINIYKNVWFDHIKKINKIKFQKSIVDNFQLKIIKNNDFKTKVMINNTLINLSENNITQLGIKSKILLELYAVWINNYNMGIIFRPIIISLIYPEINNYNYQLIDDSETYEPFSDDEDINNLFRENKMSSLSHILNEEFEHELEDDNEDDNEESEDDNEESEDNNEESEDNNEESEDNNEESQDNNEESEDNNEESEDNNEDNKEDNNEESEYESEDNNDLINSDESNNFKKLVFLETKAIQKNQKLIFSDTSNDID